VSVAGDTFPTRPPRRRGERLSGWSLGAGALAALVCLPVLAVLAIAAAPTGGIWQQLWSTVLPGYIGNTLALMLLVGVGVALTGTTTAWLTTMCQFPGRRLFEWALLLPLAFPAYVVAIVYVELLDYAGPLQGGLRALFGWQGPGAYWFPEIRSLGGAAAMLILVLYPYVYLLARTAFLDTSVSALEVARTLGQGPWQAFRTVTLPLARPAIVIGVALALMEVLADFGTVQIFAVETFTTGIYDVWLGFNNVRAAAQLAGLLLLFVLALIWIEWSSRRGRRFHNAGRHYRALPRQPLRGGRAAAAVAACLAPLALGFLLPAAVLLAWAVRTFGDLRLGDYLSDLANTLGLGLATAALAVAVAMYLSYAMRLSHGRVLVAAARLAASGYALPGPVIAVGVLLPFAWFDNMLIEWLRAHFGFTIGMLLSGTVVALTFAYLVRFMALALGSVEASLMRVTPNMDGAARTLGHGRWSILFRVHLPLIRGGALTAALLVLVEVMKELPATLILRPFNFSTLATRVFEFAADEQFEETGLWALSIVAAGVVPVALLSLSFGRSRPGAG
jgi:iron(III) transport system permease protein